MAADWENEVRAVAAVALATSIAALAMQVFSMSGTRPDNDKSLRNVLKNVAPPGVSGAVLDAAEGFLTEALLQVETLKAKFETKQ